MPPLVRRASLGAVLSLAPTIAQAASGPELTLVWGLPFAGLLLSIALMPMLAERVWHRREGLFSALWSALLLLPLAALYGVPVAAGVAWHALLHEYLPFVALIFALFAVGGGIAVHGGPWGTPAGNTLLLGIGTLLASVMGTTGAAMVLIHPLLRANAHRTRKVHLSVFFILLVANVGGSLTPLGDPPLFLGYLRGVPFGWPAAHMIGPMLLVAGLLLLAFYLLDRRLSAGDPPPERLAFRLRGAVNLALLAAVVGIVLLQGVWQPGAVPLFGERIGAERLVGIALLVATGLLSLAVTARENRRHNQFSWDPFLEIAKLFAAIFVTMAPVVAMLDRGAAGPFAGLLALTVDAQGQPIPAVYFWMTGALSAFLDNAPTYVVFFELAGGDAAALSAAPARTLLAISAGAVFFGAVTYIGNAPNFMVRAIAAKRGVRMPSFLGYMGWSLALLLPPFLVVTLVFFRP